MPGRSRSASGACATCASANQSADIPIFTVVSQFPPAISCWSEDTKWFPLKRDTNPASVRCFPGSTVSLPGNCAVPVILENGLLRI